MKIGIIGLGFVGSAIRNAYETYNEVSLVLHDPYKNLTASQEELFACDAIFIAVPSPQNEDGSCDTSILESVLAQYKDYTGIFISKVTANPLKYKELQEQYSNLIHAPEFLVAVTANKDYLNGQFGVLGGDIELCKQAEPIIRLGQKFIKQFKFCNIQEAALVKYTINTFLATKVIFMNQLYNLVKNVDANYETVIDCVKMDPRLGNSHFQVPGPDGEYGFGGACFPKDTAALHYVAKQLKIDFSVLKEAIIYNKKIRNNKYTT